MTGICGLYQFKQKPVQAETLERMIVAMKQQGPESQSYWNQNAVGLGHLLLKNTPEDVFEKQPFTSSNGDYTIVASIRLDNREALAEKLEIKPEHERRMADSIILLMAYHHWEEDCLDEIQGEFAFAIWDNRRKKLFCARDPVGLRPFYYYHDQHLVAFATEIKGILSIQSISKSFNELKMVRYLTNSLSQDKEETYFEHIHRLPIGSKLIIAQDKVKLFQYWKPSPKIHKIKFKTDAQYIEHFKEIVYQAVHTRMRSRLSIGIMASGGVNSAAIAAITTSKRMQKNKETALFTCIAQQQNNHDALEDQHQNESDTTDETDIATPIEDLKDKLQHVNIHHESVEESDILTDLKATIWLTSAPPSLDHFAFRSMIKNSQEHRIKILFNGLCANHKITALGYGYALSLFIRFQWGQAFHHCKSIAQSDVNTSKWYHYKNEIFKSLVPRFIWHNHLRKKNKKSPIWIEETFIQPDYIASQKLEKKLKKTISQFFDRPYLRRKKNHLKAILETLDNDLIAEQTALASASRVVINYPLLDVKIIEFLIGIPVKYHYYHGQHHYLMKQIMGDLIPPSIQDKQPQIEPFYPSFETNIGQSTDDILKNIENLKEDDDITRRIDLDKLKKHVELLKEENHDMPLETIKTSMKALMMANFIFWINKMYNEDKNKNLEKNKAPISTQ